jgi:hypothetical protein
MTAPISMIWWWQDDPEDPDDPDDPKTGKTVIPKTVISDTIVKGPLSALPRLTPANLGNEAP